MFRSNQQTKLLGDNISLFFEPDLLENRETEDSECKMIRKSEDRNLYRHGQFIIITIQ